MKSVKTETMHFTRPPLRPFFNALHAVIAIKSALEKISFQVKWFVRLEFNDSIKRNAIYWARPQT
ncbi:hypothetical protein QN416_26535, partial [Glaciimonas sp. Cout2]|uniref:hypothetical protein n=1 Tax=Glaciimonas sp. Cout2 TaxID=3048621 RepID=UPI002B238CD2